jgi:hypothetical protein
VCNTRQFREVGSCNIKPFALRAILHDFAHYPTSREFDWVAGAARRRRSSQPLAELTSDRLGAPRRDDRDCPLIL